jgi:hypothetical protein
MRNVLISVCGLAIVLGVAACSRNKQPGSFETVGLVAPVSQCAADPRSFGEAEKISDVNGKSICEVRNAYKVYGVSGVSFSQPAIVNCNVAGRFNDWVSNTVQNAAEDHFGERVVSLDIAAAYACRPRNNKAGAKMSEHGFGNAMDVSGFTLESGRKVSVLKDYYGSRDERNFLRAVRGEACGTFHTVLGPGSDANHKDHFHFDLANRRSGSTYCH